MSDASRVISPEAMANSRCLIEPDPRDPNHPDRAALLKDLENLRHNLSQLDEVYRDDVIERIVRSRTNPEGEVEFVDPDALLRQLKLT